MTTPTTSAGVPPWPARFRHAHAGLLVVTIGALLGAQSNDLVDSDRVVILYVITGLTVLLAGTIGGFSVAMVGTVALAGLSVILDAADGGIDFDDSAAIEHPLVLLLLGGCVAVATELVASERHKTRRRAIRDARLERLDATLAALEPGQGPDDVGRLAADAVAGGEDDAEFVAAINERVHVAVAELDRRAASRAELDADKVANDFAHALVNAASVDEVRTSAVAMIADRLHRGAEVIVGAAPDRGNPRRLAIGDATVGWLVVHGEVDALGEDAIDRIQPALAAALDRAVRFDELARTATTLERSLLPEALLPVPNLDVATRYLPATRGHQVGGDFYDAIRSPDGRVTLIVGDVQGKGVEAATVTSLARHTLRTGALEGDRPAELLARLNEALLYGQAEQAVAGHDPMVRFVTAAVASLVPLDEGFELTVACGGQPPPLLVRQGGAVDVLSPAGMLLGVAPRPSFEELKTRMDLAETLVLYTDGVTEQRRSEHVFDEHQLGLMVRGRLGPVDAEAIAQLIQDTVLLVSPEDVRDDVAVVVACVTGAR